MGTGRLKNGEDIYCRTASRMFGVPVEKHGVNGHLRQKGKIEDVLACIAEGELVLTDKGLVPIENLQKLINYGMEKTGFHMMELYKDRRSD